MEGGEVFVLALCREIAWRHILSACCARSGALVAGLGEGLALRAVTSQAHRRQRRECQLRRRPAPRPRPPRHDALSLPSPLPSL